MKLRFCSAVALAFFMGTVFAAASFAQDQEGPVRRFIQLADPQLGMGGYEHDVETLKLAVASINALKPDFVVVCGDLVNVAGDEAFTDFTEIIAGLEMPVYCAAGNHDVGSPPTPESLALYRELVGKDYYTVDKHGLRLVVVNTQLWKTPVEGETAKQDTWLKQTLAEARSKEFPVVIVGHHPFYLNEPEEGEEYFNLPPETRVRLLKLFKESGVVAVLTGHAHKEILRKFDGMLMVTTPTTSKNFDGAPMGFRLWEVGKDGALKHTYTAIEGAKPPEEK